MPRRARLKSRVKFPDRKSEHWIPKPEFCVAHLLVVSGLYMEILRVRCLLIDNELGYGKDAHRFAVPQGVFTSEFQLCPQHAFSRLSRRLGNRYSPCLTGFTQNLDFFDEKLGAPKMKTSASALQAQQHSCQKLELK